jgi:hypothetical protein
MRESPLTTVFTGENYSEAEAVIGWLRTAGLHPAELGLTAPLPFERMERKFPIEVPAEEAEKARIALENRPRLVNV